MITLYGASSAYAGSSGGWGTAKDQIVPRPLDATHSWSSDRQYGHIGRGGIRRRPQLEQVCTSSSPRAVPAQKGAAVSSSRSGSSQVASVIAGTAPRSSGHLRRW